MWSLGIKRCKGIFLASGQIVSMPGIRKFSASATFCNAQQFKDIIVEKSEKIHKITLNRPTKKNALTPEVIEMYGEIVSAMKASAESDSLLTVFTGSGDFYCSGNDLSNFSLSTDLKKLAADSRKLLQNYISAFIDHPKPLVALVNGPAVGISVTVLGLFDLIYASDKAYFHTPFGALGQSPEGVSSSTFPSIMGLGKATEFLLFNKKLTAEEAHRLNLVTEVFPHTTFFAETNKKLAEISKLMPETILLSRKMMRQPYIDHWNKVNKIECELLENRWQSKECLTALAKFFSRPKK